MTNYISKNFLFLFNKTTTTYSTDQYSITLSEIIYMLFVFNVTVEKTNLKISQQ